MKLRQVHLISFVGFVDIQHTNMAGMEGQREVKSTYGAIIAHVKPALEELATRNIDGARLASNRHHDSRWRGPRGLASFAKVFSRFA